MRSRVCGVSHRAGFHEKSSTSARSSSAYIVTGTLRMNFKLGRVNLEDEARFQVTL